METRFVIEQLLMTWEELILWKKKAVILKTILAAIPLSYSHLLSKWKRFDY